jgi:hypothetical protein
MITYIENYGEDIDGNRGVPTRMYELEPSDRDMVIEAIQDQVPYLLDDYDSSTTAEIELLCPITDNMITIEIYIGDWL